jgi:carbonic anhydrase
MNYDIKIPGEHTLEGVAFDAEIQMLHVHPGDVPRMGSIGIPVRATNETAGYNSEFQMIINQFQMLYDSHAATCARRRNLRQRQADDDDDDNNNDNDKDDNDKEPIPDDPVVVNRPNKFDPYQPALMPTMYFYRYDGSITEPPCKDITWWVMMEPMIISHRQLDQLKMILFTHVDPEQDCRRTSVHNADQSVARPLYDRGDREIQKCDDEFRSDLSKGRTPGNRCTA